MSSYPRLLLPLLLLTAAVPAAAAEAPLELETIALIGNDRTPREIALLYFPLAEGDPVTPDGLLDAVDALRASELFTSVDFRTRVGSVRGRVALDLLVEERGVEFRFGTGFRDLDGWYLIPAQLRFDNRLGRGERIRLQVKLGYRIAGVEFLLEEPRVGDGQTFWGIRAGGYGTTRTYYVDETEYEHRLGRGLFEAHLGRRIGRSWAIEIGGGFESVDSDSVPEAAEDDEFREIERGDELPFDELPPAIASHVGIANRSIFHAQLAVDTRSRRRVAATPASGLWGRLRGEGRLGEGPDVVAVTADLRAYRRLLGGGLALRLKGGAIGEAAPWYDRYYLGGLYTVRGFPGQSLSPSGGDTRFWTASLEFRARLAGNSADPRVAAVLFVDAGDGWTGTDVDWDDVSASAGYGFRLRLPWIHCLGIDFGVPITDSPVRESFRAHAALGWNF